MGFGWVHIPIAPVGPLPSMLTPGDSVFQKVRGWFCWGCRGVAPESVGVMVFTRDHARCGR